MAMVPLADMLNHKYNENVRWTFSNTKNGFEMTAVNEIKRNQQIFGSYGKKLIGNNVLL